MLVIMNKHHKHMCYNEIGFCAQYINIILGSNSKHDWESLYFDNYKFSMILNETILNMIQQPNYMWSWTCLQ